MPRPRKCRLVKGAPKVDFFKPRGVPMRELTEVYLTVEGYEALRLAELEGLTQGDAAERMKVSRHTFGRILAQARKAVAQAVVQGRALRIEGGDYEFRDHPGPECTGRTQTFCQETAPFGPDPNKEHKMGKIAVTSEGPTLEDRVDPRFGRCGGFVVFDPESGQTEYLDNGASMAMAQGAGIKAAETVASAGVDVLLTGYVGPKAFQALSAAGVKVGQNLDNLTVAEALEKYKNNEVDTADGPNKEGHWQ